MKIIKKVCLVLSFALTLMLMGCDQIVFVSDLDKVINTLGTISVGYVGDDNLENITSNVFLPTEFSDVTVTWTSNNENIISNTGVVTRPENDTEVKLSVTVKCNEETLTKSFIVIVKGTKTSGGNDNPGNDNPGTGTTELTSIANALKLAEGDSAKIQGTIVGVYSRGFMVYDGSDYILAYIGSVTPNNVGEYVELSGELSAYNGRLQFTSTCTITTLNEGTNYNLDTINIETSEFDSKVGSLTFGQKVSVVAKVDTVSVSYVNMSVADNTNGVALAYLEGSSKLNIGGLYRVTGFYMYTKAYNNVDSIYLMATDVSEYDNVTISFDYEGVNSITAYKGVEVGILPVVEKFGYIFKGWYNGEESVDEFTVFVADATLTAKFEKIELSEENQNRVNQVVSEISELGDVVATEEFGKKLKSVEDNYASLDETSKLMVSNYDDLVSARKEYDKLNQTNAICATFEFGSNGEAAHADGSAATEYSESNNGYTLSITNCAKVFKDAFDEKGNSCLKMGTSSVGGGFEFTVAEDVNSVVIRFAGYKKKDVVVIVNGVEYKNTTYSADGEYAEITIDTTEVKTIKFTTGTGYRAMINSISYVK